MVQEASRLLGLGKWQQAQKVLRPLLRRETVAAEVRHVWGVSLVMGGQLEAAVPWLKQAAVMDASDAGYQHSVAMALFGSGRGVECEPFLRRAVRLEPQRAEFRRSLADWLVRKGALADAERHLRAACAGSPDAEAWRRLGIVQTRARRLGPAARSLQRAVEMNQDDAEAWAHLGNALQWMGDLDGAMGALEQAYRLAPHPQWLSCVLRCLCYKTGVDGPAFSRAHRDWADRHARPAPRRPPIRWGKGKPRLGYLSSLFAGQAEMVEPILRGHDGDRFEVFRFDVTGIGPATAAAQVRECGIDIAIDCDGHFMGGRCIQVLAHRPARVQAALSLYPGTTGSRAIDYQIVDGRIAPEGVADALHSETLVRLPVFECYQPRRPAPPVSDNPAWRNGFVTFGSFSRPLKINGKVVRLWAEILHAVRGSRLILHHYISGPGPGQAAVEPEIARLLRRRFAEFGIRGERLRLVGSLEGREHLALYGQVDIALDPFPYNGNFTTLSALRMGVPVVSKAGETPAARVGLSLLTAAGLADWVASDERKYVDLAVRAAEDQDRLRRLRKRLPGMLRRSPIMDVAGYVKALEEAYLLMWRQRGAGRSR